MVRKLYKLIKPEMPVFSAAIAATFLNAVFLLLFPLVIQFVIDYVLTDNNPQSLELFNLVLLNADGINYIKDNVWICSLAVAGLAICQGVCLFVKGKYTSIGAEHIAKKHKDELYDHIQRLPYDYHVKAQTGDLVQRCTSDVDTVRRFIANQFIEMFRIIFNATMAFAIMLTFSVKLSLVSIIIVPIIFCSAYFYLGRIKRSFAVADAKEGELSTVMQENFTGVRVVRAFGREVFELDKFNKVNKEYTDLCYTTLNHMAVFWGISDFLCFTQVSLVMVAGSYMTYLGQISLGTMFVFAMYINRLVWPLRQLGRILSDLGKTEVSLNRINEILYTPLEENTENALSPDLKGDIVFDNVVFGYDKDKTVLKGISFKVAQGEKIAILGSTGSGKSSLAHLFLRLYEYKGGSIKINGTELRDIDKSHLRQRLGIVLQEPFLYSKSVIDNIKMAGDNILEEEVLAASKIAHIHNDISDFKEGYETIVGERGVTVSGGQKQRIAIARTLVKDSDILIFDDSLSAVDTETDALIQQELKKRGSGTTTFIISQRITTLMSADRIFVMEDGKIADQGTHEELISRDGLYYRIWNIQNTLEEEFERQA